MKDLIIRKLDTMTEFRSILELQQQIWGMPPGDCVSPYVLNAASHNGGVVIGAELDGQLVGFCFGFAGWRDGDLLLWSHMTGVLSQLRDQGIGYQLKQAQREWALQYGYRTIRWTFDPMQRGNANFNFRQLGSIANTYHVNLYGEMTDQINAGLASDRLEATWYLQPEERATVTDGYQQQDPASVPDISAFLLRVDEKNQQISVLPSALQQPLCYVEIPLRINTLKHSNMAFAQQWQLSLREALQQAFQQQVQIVDFVTQAERCWYVLKRKNTGEIERSGE